MLTVTLAADGAEASSDALTADWNRAARSGQLSPAPMVVIVVVTPSTAARTSLVNGIATTSPQPQKAMFRTVVIAIDGRNTAIETPSDSRPYRVASRAEISASASHNRTKMSCPKIDAGFRPWTSWFIANLSSSTSPLAIHRETALTMQCQLVSAQSLPSSQLAARTPAAPPATQPMRVPPQDRAALRLSRRQGSHRPRRQPCSSPR